MSAHHGPRRERATPAGFEGRPLYGRFWKILTTFRESDMGRRRNVRLQMKGRGPVDTDSGHFPRCPSRGQFDRGDMPILAGAGGHVRASRPECRRRWSVDFTGHRDQHQRALARQALAPAYRPARLPPRRLIPRLNPLHRLEHGASRLVGGAPGLNPPQHLRAETGVHAVKYMPVGESLPSNRRANLADVNFVKTMWRKPTSD